MHMNGKRVLPVLLAVILASLVIVNAAVFAYRWMTVNITVNPPDQASGAACTGFYSSSAQPGIGLPTAGTNYNAQTYGRNTITVTPGRVTCQWTSGTTTYYLYESIDVSMTLINGSWYIKDLYGFGYYTGSGSVYVTVRTEQAVSGVDYAYLYLYNASTGAQVGYIDLKTTGSSASFSLNPGQAVQLDLKISIPSPGSYSFKVGFYVTQSSEAPR